MYVSKALAAANQQELFYRAMKRAIDAVASRYRTEFERQMSNDQRREKERLDNLSLETIADIEAWESGWKNLLRTY